MAKLKASSEETISKNHTTADIDNGIRKIKRRITEIEKLIEENINNNDGRVSIAETNMRETIREVFGQNSPEFHEYQNLDLWDGGMVYSEEEAQRNFHGGVTKAMRILEGLIGRLKEKKDDIVLENEKLKETTTVLVDTRKVFIVHGHDEEAKLNVARFIEKLNLIPVILAEQPNEGKTIIEKFEKHSDVGYAIVLLTPDDICFYKNDKTKQTPRARQNVILELGYFIGKLSRAKVSALYKDSVELPSDIHGIVYIAMDTSDGWKLKLAQEMKQAGMKIDMNLAI